MAGDSVVSTRAVAREPKRRKHTLGWPFVLGGHEQIGVAVGPHSTTGVQPGGEARPLEKKRPHPGGVHRAHDLGGGQVDRQAVQRHPDGFGWH